MSFRNKGAKAIAVLALPPPPARAEQRASGPAATAPADVASAAFTAPAEPRWADAAAPLRVVRRPAGRRIAAAQGLTSHGGSVLLGSAIMAIRVATPHR